jgi:hypothetical protein
MHVILSKAERKSRNGSPPVPDARSRIIGNASPSPKLYAFLFIEASSIGFLPSPAATDSSTATVVPSGPVAR